MVAATLTAYPASAATAHFIDSGRTTLGDSRPSQGTSYDIDLVKVQTTSTIKSFRLQVCTSPVHSVSCTAPVGFVWGASIIIQAKGGTTFANPYAGTPSGSDFLMTNATGNLLSQFDVVHFSIVTTQNPSAANTTFYSRVTSCSDITCDVTPPAFTNNVDYGAMAISTSQGITVGANVQESLTFCVGTSITTTCGTISGTTVALTPNPLTASAPSTGTAVMAAVTNAGTGYSITYNATPFTNASSSVINPAASGGNIVNGGGTEQFGLTLRQSTSGNLNTLGTDPSGGTGAAVAPYNAVNSTIAYSTTGGTQVATAGGPTVQTTFTMLFAANIAPTTKPGTYVATQTYIATGNF